jgi:lysophospholipase L1-like esterase
MDARVYGDSLMKGTVIDEGYRYHAIASEEIRLFEDAFQIKVENRARFGITIEKGKRILERDIETEPPSTYALIEFGGNDCNFNWRQVSDEPEREHKPFTVLSKFEEGYRFMLEKLRSFGTIPVLMTLPPIDAEKYFTFICRGNDSGRILKWLGDVHRIYRFQELYSNVITKVAISTGTALIDIRGAFLAKRDCRELIGLDGIHLNREGYALLFETIRNFAAQRLPKIKRANTLAFA